MTETLRFESPVLKAYPTTNGELRLRDESAQTKVVVRSDSDGTAAASIGVAFGTGRSVAGVIVSGQRPGEWVVLGERAAVDSYVGSIDASGHTSIVDRTHASAMFRLTGTDAPSLLEKVCGLDWADHMTPDGAAMSASIALVGCDIVRNDTDHRSYLVMCDRSFGQYLFDALLDAGDEFGIGVDNS